MLNDGESSAYTEEDNEMEAGLGHTHTFGGGGAAAASAGTGRKRNSRRKSTYGAAAIGSVDEEWLGACGSSQCIDFFFYDFFHCLKKQTCPRVCLEQLSLEI
jgi:hypothetical protein